MLARVVRASPVTLDAVLIWASLLSTIAAEPEMLALEIDPLNSLKMVSKFELCSEAMMVAPTVKVKLFVMSAILFLPNLFYLIFSHMTG